MAASSIKSLTTKQQRAIVALLNQHTMAKAAEEAEVGERTLYRWLEDADFAAAYRRARREAFGQAIALTQRYAPVAVNTLAQVMLDREATHNSKVAAATALLRFARDGVELDDLAARVEALEQAAEGGTDRRWGSLSA